MTGENSTWGLFPADCEGCPHTVILAVPGDDDWGYCEACKDEGFPLTLRAAYGDFECGTCHDTESVPVAMPGCFADARCPDCGDGADAAVRAGAMLAGDAG